MQESEQVMCFFCLEHLGRLKIDKRGRPYISCGSCGSRTFMHSNRALNGFRLMAPLVAKLVEGLGGPYTAIHNFEEAQRVHEKTG